ncbi:MAG: hypothetical protein NTX03_07070 [Bacteroidetes bacterium]|nr:hypothetical protein [Bacteroidota bacterium]
MKRRQFIRTSALAAAGVVVAPYILPSGRLFAATGTRLVNHVVFVLFGGGLRIQETALQQYLANQGLATQGNILPNLFSGAQPSTNLVYSKWTPALSKPLASYGTLFKEISYKTGPTGHFNGHTVAMTGNYTNTQLDLRINPDSPTVFEYYRKHTDPAKSAINAWWLSEGLGPYTALNYSRHANYGADFGANFLSPVTTFIGQGSKLANTPDFQADDVLRIDKALNFLDNSFDKAGKNLPGIVNSEADKIKIEQFIKDTINRTQQSKINFALPSGVNQSELTGDLLNITYSWEVINAFEPELMVVNTFNSDICHSDFSSYIQNMHKADYGVGWLWNKIQNHPKLKNDTIMICMPEHGRNDVANNLYDSNGLKAYDHTSDDNSRRVFAIVAGPSSVVKQGQVLGSAGSPAGETIDIIPTIAHILGFEKDIPSGMLGGKALTAAFN